MSVPNLAAARFRKRFREAVERIRAEGVKSAESIKANCEQIVKTQQAIRSNWKTAPKKPHLRIVK